MTRSGKGALVIGLCVVAALRIAATDGLDPALILKPLADSWLTYSGETSILSLVSTSMSSAGSRMLGAIS